MTMTMQVGEVDDPHLLVVSSGGHACSGGEVGASNLRELRTLTHPSVGLERCCHDDVCGRTIMTDRPAQPSKHAFSLGGLRDPTSEPACPVISEEPHVRLQRTRSTRVLDGTDALSKGGILCSPAPAAVIPLLSPKRAVKRLDEKSYSVEKHLRPGNRKEPETMGHEAESLDVRKAVYEAKIGEGPANLKNAGHDLPNVQDDDDEDEEERGVMFWQDVGELERTKVIERAKSSRKTILEEEHKNEFYGSPVALDPGLTRCLPKPMGTGSVKQKPEEKLANSDFLEFMWEHNKKEIEEYAIENECDEGQATEEMLEGIIMTTGTKIMEKTILEKRRKSWKTQEG